MEKECQGKGSAGDKVGRGIGANERVIYAVWRVNDGECLFAVETGAGGDGT